MQFENGDIRQAWRAGVTVIVAYVFGLVFLKATQPHWIIISSMICLQANIGGTIRKGKQRFIGTILGCCLGVASYVFLQQHLLILSSLSFVALVLIFHKLTGSYTLYMTYLTYIVVLIMIWFSHGDLRLSILRVEDVGIGILIGFMGSFFLWPQTAVQSFFMERQSVYEKTNLLLQELKNWSEALVQATQDKEKILDFRNPFLKQFDALIQLRKQELVSKTVLLRNRLSEMQYEIFRKSSRYSLFTYEEFILSHERFCYSLISIYHTIGLLCFVEHKKLDDQDHILLFFRELQETYNHQQKSSLMEEKKIKLHTRDRKILDVQKSCLKEFYCVLQSIQKMAKKNS